MDDDDDSDRSFLEYSDEARLIDEVSNFIVVHQPPPVVLGAGRSKVSDKFVALMHSV